MTRRILTESHNANLTAGVLAKYDDRAVVVDDAGSATTARSLHGLS
jgi:hypothetical protein